MKKPAKQSPKASPKKVIKDLEVKPAKGGTVRGGVRKAGEKPLEF